MHEMSLCESILKIVQDQAASQKFERVITVYLELGVLSHVTPEAMLFCFDIVTKDSLADGAKLEIHQAPGQAWCLGCEKNVKIEKWGQPCPECTNYNLQITAGDEMKVTELEVE